MSVHRLLKWFEKGGFIDWWLESGRPVTVTTEENEELVDLICSQEENPGTYLPPREIEKVTGPTSLSNVSEKNGKTKRLKAV